MDDVLAQLRAAGEATRLRILTALQDTELNVGDLCRVLGQSQPRVSRHLKLLQEAGLIVRAAEGASAYFRLTDQSDSRRLLDVVFERIDASAPQVVADRAAIDQIRAERADAARRYFDDIAAEWDRIRPMHVADEDVEAALLAQVADRHLDCVVDIGTGTGRMLELFAPHTERGIGIDTSAAMLRNARAHLDGPEFAHLSVRSGDATALDLEAGTVDLVVLHHVLHFVEEPADVLREAGRVLRPDGMILVVDFARHELESLRREFAHRHLGFDHDQLDAWCAAAGLAVEHVEEFVPGESPALGVRLWRATPTPLTHATTSGSTA